MNISQLPRLLPAALLLLLLSGVTAAQEAKIFVVSTQSAPDEPFGLEVRADGLMQAVGIQLSVSWDTSALDFLGVEDVILEGNLDDNFNQTQIDSGRIGFLVFDQNIEGLSLMDSSLLFRLRFNPVGGDGTLTEVTFTEEPVKMVVSDPQNDTISTRFVAGEVSIGMVNAVRNAFAEDARFTAAPNPFVDRLTTNFSVGYAGEAALAVLDANGRLLSERSLRMVAGQNQVTLQAADFPTAGPYFLRLTTDRERLYRKVILGRTGR